MAIFKPDYGSYYNVYTYMGWQTITDPTSQQYKLRQEAGMNFDSEGFARIDGYYVIACTTTCGQVGDYIDWALADGSILHTIVGDIKNPDDDNWTKWGHEYDGVALCVIEFIVNMDTWYTEPPHVNPGTATCHPEWAGKIIQGNNFANYWTGRAPSVDPSGAGNGNLYVVTAQRLYNEKVYECTFTASLWADGYLYFNDYEFFRCYPDASHLQLFYIPKQIWLDTNKLRDLVISAVNTNGSMLGGIGVQAALMWARIIANDDTHGYDQENRWGPDYDCSSFVYEAFRIGGGFSGLPVQVGNTQSMVTDFTGVGFTWYSGAVNVAELQSGDILLNVNNHTEIYIGDGMMVGAHINEFGETTGGQTGDQTGQEISVRQYYNYPWDGYLRYTGAGSARVIALANTELSRPITLRTQNKVNNVLELRQRIADEIREGKYVY